MYDAFQRLHVPANSIRLNPQKYIAKGGSLVAILDRDNGVVRKREKMVQSIGCPTVRSMRDPEA
jgi:Flp pilus assembly protein TadB